MLNKSRPVLKAHQEVPRPPHADEPRATQKRRPTARSAQQMTRLPPSRAGEHTDGRTRTVFQHCDATMCTSTRRGREKTAQGARAQRRRPPTRTDDPTARRPGVAAIDAEADRRPGPRCRCKPHPPPRPSATIKTPETHKTRPSDKKQVGPATRSSPHGAKDARRNRRKRILQHGARSCNGLGRPRRPNEAIKTRERLNSKRARAIKSG